MLPDHMAVDSSGGDPGAIALRLRWRRTWPDEDKDFVVRVEWPGPDGRMLEHSIGRIYWSYRPNGAPQWQWHYQAALPGLPWNRSDAGGHEHHPRFAARQVEDRWFRASAGTQYANLGLDKPRAARPPAARTQQD